MPIAWSGRKAACGRLTAHNPTRERLEVFYETNDTAVIPSVLKDLLAKSGRYGDSIASSNEPPLCFPTSLHETLDRRAQILHALDRASQSSENTCGGTGDFGHRVFEPNQGYPGSCLVI